MSIWKLLATMSQTAYKWECPLCGESRLRLSGHAGPSVEATHDLIEHIQKTNDDRHGSSGTCPDGINLNTLGRYTSPQQLES